MKIIFIIKNTSMYLNMYVSICLCLYLYTYSYVGTWTFMCILTDALLLSPWEEILNSTREQFKRFILNGIVIISVLGLNYFYYTGTKNFTSVGFYQMYSRGFINLKFYDTCSNIFYHYFYWFGFLLTVNLAFLKQGKHAFDNVAYCLHHFCELCPLKDLISC